MIFRGFQGGFQVRKLRLWVLSSNRFRLHYLIFFIFTAYPLRLFLEGTLFIYVHNAWNKISTLFRPKVHATWNTPVRQMSPINAVSFVPPSQKYLKFSVDANDEEQLEKENNLYMKYREMYTVDIIRTSGFVHHPSRETNSIVEGEIFKNEQDKIVESMRIMMAEFGVKKGIWHDLNHAFAQSDSIRAKRFRQMLS